MDCRISLLEGRPADRMELLRIATLDLIKGNELPAEVGKWLGLGLLALSDGKDANEAFTVRKRKKDNSQLRSMRYALVQNEMRENGLTQEKAFEAVAILESAWRKEPYSDARRWLGIKPNGSHKQDIDAEAIEKSFKAQKKVQKELAKKVAALRKDHDS